MRKWLNHQSVRPLRRFLRALNIDTVWAEEWLRLTYASAETDEVLSGTATASAKFQVFKDFFSDWAAQRAGEAGSGNEGAPLPFTDDRLRTFVPNLPPVSEQMLLLCDFVGFSVEEGADLLDLTPEQGAVELEEGRKLTRNLAPLPVLILEDHGLIAQDLSDIIGETGLSVIGTVANEADAKKACRQNWPDIIVSDQMLEGGDTGLQAIERLRADGDFAAIYVTAYPDEVLTGLEDEPAVIVAKPFKPEAIRAALGYTVAASDRLGSVIDAEAEREIG